MSQRAKRLHQRRRGSPKQKKPHPIKTAASGLAVAAMLTLVAWAWWGAETPGSLPDPPSWLPKCPVGGGPVNLALRVSTPGGPVFFCCKHCMKRWNTEPGTFDNNLEVQRNEIDALARIQVSCPVSGNPVAATIFIDSVRGPVRFCSTECRDRYSTAPDEFETQLVNSYWYQTSCPVDERQVTPGVSTAVPSGETVYFCSETCRHAFVQDPARYAAQLADQGVRLHLHQ